MKQNNITVSHMIDIALGTPEPGNINFAILHSLLHIIVNKLNLTNQRVEFCGADNGMVEELISQMTDKFPLKVKEILEDPHDVEKRYIVKQSNAKSNTIYMVVRNEDEHENLTDENAIPLSQAPSQMKIKMGLNREQASVDDKYKLSQEENIDSLDSLIVKNSKNRFGRVKKTYEKENIQSKNKYSRSSIQKSSCFVRKLSGNDKYFKKEKSILKEVQTVSSSEKSIARNRNINARRLPLLAKKSSKYFTDKIGHKFRTEVKGVVTSSYSKTLILNMPFKRQTGGLDKIRVSGGEDIEEEDYESNSGAKENRSQINTDINTLKEDLKTTPSNDTRKNVTPERKSQNKNALSTTSETNTEIASSLLTGYYQSQEEGDKSVEKASAYNFVNSFQKLNEDMENLKLDLKVLDKTFEELRKNGFNLELLRSLKEIDNYFKLLKNDCSKTEANKRLQQLLVEHRKKNEEKCISNENEMSETIISETESFSSSNVLIEFPVDVKQSKTLSSKTLVEKNIYPLRTICDYLVKDTEFVKKINDKVLKRELCIVNDFEHWKKKMEKINECFNKFLEQNAIIKEEPSTVTLQKEIFEMKKYHKNLNEAFLSSMHEIQDMLDAKLNKEFIPDFKVYIKSILTEIQDQLDVIKSNMNINCAIGTTNAIVKDLKCLSCDTTVCQSRQPGKVPPFAKYPLKRKPANLQNNKKQQSNHNNKRDSENVKNKCDISKKRRSCGGSHTVIKATEKVPKYEKVSQIYG